MFDELYSNNGKRSSTYSGLGTEVINHGSMRSELARISLSSTLAYEL